MVPIIEKESHCFSVGRLLIWCGPAEAFLGGQLGHGPERAQGLNF